MLTSAFQRKSLLAVRSQSLPTPVPIAASVSVSTSTLAEDMIPIFTRCYPGVGPFS